MIFRALTVRQPYASAMFFGLRPKDVENRSRRPPEHIIGQRLWIHAGEALEQRGLVECWNLGFNGMWRAEPPPHGVILGSVLLDGYAREVDSPWRDPSVEYGWILRDPQPLAVPIPVPGGGALTLGWRVPEDVAVQIVAQERGELRAA